MPYKHVTEGKRDVAGKRGRRRKQLPDVLKEMRKYQKLKGVALDHSLGRTRPGKRFGPFASRILVDETPDNGEEDCYPGLDERIIWVVTQSKVCFYFFRFTFLQIYSYKCRYLLFSQGT